MKKIAQAMQGLRDFLGEVQTELKKCSWPTRQELVDSTLVVIISVIILAIYVGIGDFALMHALNAVVR